MQREHLAIDHDIDGSIQLKLNAPRSLSLSQRMLDVSAVIQAGQIADETQSPDRSPANVFHQPVPDFGLGRNHHRATSELAVVESDEQAWAVVKTLFALHSDWKWTAIEACEGEEDGCDISQFAPSAKAARAKRCDIRGKSHAQ